MTIEAEKSVLGCMLIDPECVDEVMDIISVQSFSQWAHQEIYKSIINLHKEGSYDVILVKNDLEKRGKLKHIGGQVYLESLFDLEFTSIHARQYASIVSEGHKKKILTQTMGEINNALESSSEPVAAIIEKAEKKLFEIGDTRRSQCAEAKSLLPDIFEQIDKRREGGVTGIESGFVQVDETLYGFQEGYYVLAGRPSMGKTALAMNICENMALRGIKAGFFSLEMSKEQLVERMLSSLSWVPLEGIRRGRITDRQHRSLIEAGSRIDNVYIDDAPDCTPVELRSRARRLRRKGVEIFFVDYLQLMTSGMENRQQDVSFISRNLKALAKELHVPVVVLSQLNRAAEAREGHRPRMSDLRESGSIEQDADVVMLLHREDYYHKEIEYTPTNTAELIIAKHRNGPTGTVELVFDGTKTQFKNKYMETQ